ncbi:MAG: arginine--tRNA ligase [Bacteroidetes bacterium]|nr:arginine--tRNA ligase [Bacteroidota bacterium]
MEQEIKKIVFEKAIEIFGQIIPEKIIQTQKTRGDVKGDLTLVLFPIVGMLKSSPQEIGNKIGDFLVSNTQWIDSYEVAGGFLNLVASQEYWLNRLKEINAEAEYGFAQPNSKIPMMVEYSSPNTNKPLHLGHLRNIFLGHAVAEILKANGHEVIKTQIINDRGIHICKSMLAWERFSPENDKGEKETPSNTGLKGDKLVGKYYVEFDKNFVREAKEIIAKWEDSEFDGFENEVVLEYQKLHALKEGKDEKTIKGLDAKILDLAKNQTGLLRDAKEMLVKWEARDPQTYLLWNTMNGWVYEGFESTYKMMGVEFDKVYYESDTFILGKDLVMEGLEKDIFYQKEDGSIWVDLTADGLDEKLLLRSDGTAVYMTQDMGTAKDRFADFPNLGGMIYTVGNEQDYHFKVLFLILQKLGFAWANNCHHLSYGMVDLPSGKMKSREGTVVDADDLMAEVVQKAKEATLDRGHIADMSENEVDTLCNLIGMGGLKYYLLKVDPKKRMLFDPAESIELNGNTGPFIQYAYARIQSLLRKGEVSSLSQELVFSDVEIELLKKLNDAPKALEEAAQQLAPSLIANYLFELVKAFNHFYQNVTIFGEEVEDLKNMRLVLSDNVGKVIKSYFNLLGIQVPSKM